ncbi:MAG: ribosome maturation factor RimP [Betaproteobacteria bacterium]|nr:ribosome maturation factor RimP [Betaproteobacteria bacterium]
MELRKLIEQTVAGMGFELVELEMSTRGRLLRVFIDQPEGIGVEDCAVVSNQLTRVFEVENVDYDRLEVSSPGLDRPLTKLAHFVRFVGEVVLLKTRVPVGNQRNFKGVLSRVEGEQVVLNTESGEHSFGFEDIERARLVPKV